MSALPGGSGITISSFFGGEAGVHLLAGTQYRISVDRLWQPGPFTLTWDMPQAAPVLRVGRQPATHRSESSGHRRRRRQAAPAAATSWKR